MSRIGSNAAKSGILTYQEAMNVTANNIANVNTTGYKPFRASLSDLIYTERDADVDLDYQRGHGVRNYKTDFKFAQGAPKETGLDLDFYLGDRGLFMVEDVNGNTFFTKDGAFQITQTGEDVWQLCDNFNSFVLDDEGNRITVPFLTDQEGNLTQAIDYEALEDAIGKYQFENPSGLQKIGDNYYAQTDSSGEPVSNPDTDMRRGYLELSDTELSEEMVNMITVQRAFQVNIKMYQTFSEMTQQVNSLKG
ncbi:MAG: flagellar hook-basal body protein [Ruminococcus sp.]|jgi:flagellar basal-body rod protein FlgG|nr:flagellar hook-basal body protein [Ruminococcus sp.]